MTKGHCTLSPKFSYAFFSFFVFVILSYQNACYGCENAENRTRSEFLWRTKVSEAVCKRDWGRIYFLTCENFGTEFQTQCAKPFILFHFDKTVQWTVFHHKIKWNVLLDLLLIFTVYSKKTYDTTISRFLTLTVKMVFYISFSISKRASPC